MEYNSNKSTIYFPATFDGFDETRKRFHKYYIGLSEDEREKLARSIYKSTTPFEQATIIIGKEDSVFFEPTDREIDMLFWEFIKNELKEYFFWFEFPLKIGTFIADKLSAEGCTQQYMEFKPGIRDVMFKARCKAERDEPNLVLVEEPLQTGRKHRRRKKDN